LSQRKFNACVAIAQRSRATAQSKPISRPASRVVKTEALKRIFNTRLANMLISNAILR